jgi:predicted SAM-dependent methyltransferase
MCPGCGSLERHRLHWKYMLDETNLFKKGTKLKILHVAPEKIFYDKFHDDKHFEYVNCAKFGEGYTDQYFEDTLNVDITEMGFPDNCFDVIYCSHVLEHVPNDKKAMQEFLRVLKNDGWAMLQVPIDKSRNQTYEDFSITDKAGREKAFGQNDHVRVYGNDYKFKLEDAGFHVNVKHLQAGLNDKELNRYGFMKDEDIFICTRNKQHV